MMQMKKLLNQAKESTTLEPGIDSLSTGPFALRRNKTEDPGTHQVFCLCGFHRAMLYTCAQYISE